MVTGPAKAVSSRRFLFHASCQGTSASPSGCQPRDASRRPRRSNPF
jgi:hypothetical protein